MNEPKKPAQKHVQLSDDAPLLEHEALSKALDAMYKLAGGPDHESGRWSKFGHMPTNPIYAPSRLDAMKYLARLRLPDGQQVLHRQSRMLAANFSPNPIECFEITRLDDAPLATLYVSLGSGRNSEDVPEGFLLEPPGAG